MPVERHPLLRWRMADDHAWGGVVTTAKKQPEARRGPAGGRARPGPGDPRRARAPGRCDQAGQGGAGEHVELERGEEGDRVAVLAGRGVRGAQPHHLRPPLRAARARDPGRCAGGADARRRRRHEGAAAPRRSQPRRRDGALPGRLPPPQHRHVAPAPRRARGRRSPALGHRRGLEAPGVPPPRGNPSPVGAGVGAPVPLRLPRVGAPAHRAPVRLPLPHRDLRAGRAAGARLLRPPLPPRRSPGGSHRSQGRPAGRHPSRARRLRRADLGRRP